MDTAFLPRHIDPGDPVAFTASMSVYESKFYDPHQCTPFERDGTEIYDNLGIWRVRPNSTAWDAAGPGQDPPVGYVVQTPEYTNFTNASATCPDGTFDEQATTQIPGSQTALLYPGCYQAEAWNAGLWFGSSGADPTSGTISTLTIGDVHCARKKGGSLQLDCNGLEVCRIDIACDSSPDGCNTVSAVDSGCDCVKGRNLFSAHSSFEIAKANVSLLPNERARIELPVTKRGRAFLKKARRTGKAGPFKGWVEFDGDRSTRQAVKIVPG